MGTILSIVVPAAFVFIVVLVKQLGRGTPIRIQDFYLGLELGLANLTSAMLQLCDLAQLKTINQAVFARSVVFCCFSFFWLMAVMSIHQHQEKDAEKPGKRQIFWLCGFANVIGFVMFFAFLLWVKGV